MPINLSLTSEQSILEFTRKLNGIDPSKLELLDITLDTFKNALGYQRNDTLWWQIAAYALPTLLDWRLNIPKKTGITILPAVNMSRYFYRILKSNDK